MKSVQRDGSFLSDNTEPSPIDLSAILQQTPNTDPAPSAIREILPSIATHIDSWRQYRPISYTVKLSPNSREIAFYLSEIKDEGRFTTWIGRSATAGESFVAVATEHGLDAIVTTLFEPPVEIQIRGDLIAITKATASTDTVDCGSLPEIPIAKTAPAEQVTSQALLQDGSGNSMAGVVYLYDNLALAQANIDALDGNGAALIDSTLKARLESANTYLANSQINVRWNYLGCFQCPDHGDTPIESLWAIVRTSATSVGAFAWLKAA